MDVKQVIHPHKYESPFRILKALFSNILDELQSQKSILKRG
jgi:hypothetical protein